MAGEAVMAAIKARDLVGLRVAAAKDLKTARSPRALIAAGFEAWKPALVLLHKIGADLNESYKGYRALHGVVQTAPHCDSPKPTAGRRACLDWLLAHGANPELTAGWPPARAALVAAFSGERAFVDRLIDGGVRVDGFVSAALGRARGVAAALDVDLTFATARDQGGLTALQCAAASKLGLRDKKVGRGLLEVAEVLIDAGADVNARTKGWAHELDVVYFVTGSGNRELYVRLLERGADPTEALPSAVWSGRYEWAELAMARGGEPDRARDHGRPLLNELIRWGQVKPALWLLEHRADPNLADDRGWTAVHQAASRGNERLMRGVLAAGGDRRRRDRGGHTPRDIAKVMNRVKLLPLL